MLIFIPFAMMSVVLNVDNLLLGKIWFGLRIVYLFGHITDIIQTYCMFNHEIVTLLDNKTSNLSCVHRGKARTERKLS